MIKQLIARFALKLLIARLMERLQLGDAQATTRCTFCSAEFTDAQLKGANCCPLCGRRGLPMAVSHDATIRINVHELRILAIWAENHAVTIDNQHLDDARHESLKETVNVICGRLHPQLTAQGIDMPLTLSEEVKELQRLPQIKGDVTLYRDGREEIT